MVFPISLAALLLAAPAPGAGATPRAAPVRAAAPAPATPPAPARAPAPAPAFDPTTDEPTGALLPSASSTGLPALRVAFLDAKVSGDAPHRPVEVFLKSLLPEARKLAGVSAIGVGEARAWLGLDKERQRLGCRSDDACFTDLAAALGVDDLVAVELEYGATDVTLSLQRLDPRMGKLRQVVAGQLERRDGEELLRLVGPSFEVLFADRPLRPGETRGASDELVRRLHPALPRWVFAATATAAAGALAGGGVYGILTSDTQDKYYQLFAGSTRVTALVAPLAALREQANSMSRTANTLFVTAAVLAVGAGVVAWFTDWSGGPQEAEVRGIGVVGEH